MLNPKKCLTIGLGAALLCATLAPTSGCGGGGGTPAIVPILTLVQQIAAANSPMAARNAVLAVERKLRFDTGDGSRYADITTGAMIRDQMADAILFDNGIGFVDTMGELYAYLQSGALIAGVDDSFNGMRDRLQGQVNAAWADQEAPASAAIILMLSDGFIEPTPPMVTADTPVNSFQAFLFVAWLATEYDTVGRDLQRCLRIARLHHSMCLLPLRNAFNHQAALLGFQKWRIIRNPSGDPADLEQKMTAANLTDAEKVTMRNALAEFNAGKQACDQDYANRVQQCHNQGG